MKFRTDIRISEPNKVILDPAVPCALAGSCFTQNIAHRMRSALWDAAAPFGTLYNPSSIHKILEIVVSGNSTPIMNSLFEDKGIWHSYLLDSSFSADDSAGVIEKYLKAMKVFSNALEKGRQLIITFGTAWIYELKGTAEIVANCHKQPSCKFIRRRLTVDEITATWGGLLSQLAEKYPSLKIILTVSPVRHLKDGFTGNTLSKAILNLAVERICGNHPSISWFPAYEILIDDLRDYRFYSSDLVHPSEQAIEYVWEKFRETYIASSGEEFLKEGEKLRKSLDHRVLISTDAKEIEYEEYLSKVSSRIDAFISRYPYALDPRIL